MAVLRDALLAWPSGSEGRTVLLAVGMGPELLERVRFATAPLAGRGFELRVLPELATAAEAAARRSIFLLDVAIGSSEVRRFLRETRSRQSPAPVVVVGSEQQEELLVEALDCGAADYLTSSDLTPPVMRRVLRYALDRDRLQHLARRIYQDSARQEQRIWAFLAALPQAALLLDAEGHVRLANARAEEVLARSLEAIRSQSVQQWGWGSPGGVDSYELYVPLATLQDGFVRTGRLRTLTQPDGRVIEVRVDARALFERGPFRPSGAVLLLEEVNRA